MKSHLSNMYKNFKREKKNRELFEYLRTCGNGTRNPPTTPGGMTVRPVSTGTTLSILDAPSKLRATIFHISSLQLMGMRLHAPSVEAI